MVNVDILLELLRGSRVRVVELRKPRIREMFNYELLFGGKHLAFMRVFKGRPPYYRGWIEFYTINWEDAIRHGLDRVLARAAYEALERNETIFFEYVGDNDTLKSLERGVRPEETRLGRILVEAGFKGLVDMYYPEGFMEGGPKLRGYKG